MKLIKKLILLLENIYIFLFLTKSSKDKTKIDLEKSYTKNCIIPPFYLLTICLLIHFITIPFLQIINFVIFIIFLHIWIFTIFELKKRIKNNKNQHKGDEK